ncbi:hypothetical protein EAS56_16670 [Bradyrhizobium guangzhouense]|uniref:Uncharacterized protein n=1 Tax=Bradyrhizobium guangzhouense TaxID=1325095 RepID=A0AAE5X774_9BRAD|nr:hypothetical protein XH91_04020 [Bradyrhizobium guangzhouense]RXH12718.1 hypothetical protein EAS56_16670 [Bradyrhizobium guangzhouense]
MATCLGGPPLSVNPFDSLPILIRLRAIPNLRISAIKSSLVRHPKTPSSAHAKRVPRHLA